MTQLEQQIQTLAEEALAAHGLVLVCARLMGGARALTLQVLAEKPDGTGAGLEECRQVSRTLSAQLDVADILNTRYMLEVGSPGMDRPLMKAEDYKRFEGRQAKLSLNRKVSVPTGTGEEMVTSVVGVIGPSTEKSVTLLMGHWKNPVAIAYADIRSAHLHPSKEELDAVMDAANLKGKNEKREERDERRSQRPAFKRGNVVLDARERRQLGVMTDEERSAAKAEKRAQTKKDVAEKTYRKRTGKPDPKAVAKRAWTDRKGKPSGKPSGKSSGRPAGKSFNKSNPRKGA